MESSLTLEATCGFSFKSAAEETILTPSVNHIAPFLRLVVVALGASAFIASRADAGQILTFGGNTTACGTVICDTKATQGDLINGQAIAVDPSETGGAITSLSNTPEDASGARISSVQCQDGSCIDIDNFQAPDGGQYQFDTELSGMAWIGCIQGQTCQENVNWNDNNNAKRSVAETLFTSYAGIAAGANFDVSFSSVKTANDAMQMNWVSEPASFALFGFMLLGLGFIAWRKLNSSR
jgi:hypothetical protein